MKVSSIPVERRTVDLPDGVTVTVDDDEVTVDGPEGRTERTLPHPKIEITVEDDEVVVLAEQPTRPVAALVGTFAGHVRNMVKGAGEGFEAELRVVSSHFPIKARVEGDQVVIDNFLGEKAARRADILGDTDVEVSGEDVLVRGANKEHVGQTAVNIERATDTSGYDPRVFQDGIYLIRKPS
jgi:large subunit ribosomal protein L6